VSLYNRLNVLLVAAPLLAYAYHPDLEPARLEALHQQRVEWMKIRRVDPPHGVYQDFRVATAPMSVLPFRVQELARAAGVQILLTEREPRTHNGVLWMRKPESFAQPELPNLLPDGLPKPRDLKRWFTAFKQYPVEFAGLTGGAPLLNWFKIGPDQAPLAPVSTHVLARELSESEVQKSIQEGRSYLAHEWLCDPAGFGFWAVNNQGVFELGDRIPIPSTTRIEARSPVPAHFRLFLDDTVIHEEDGQAIRYTVKGPGAYRLELELDALGKRRPWIQTKPIYLTKDELPKMPALVTSDEAVEAVKNIAYIENGDAKQRLDLYLPKGKSQVPLFVFVHGGAWTSGDRALYTPIGVMLAKRGIATAIPSYRLMPRNPHPAQIEDVAAAFAWVAKNVAKYPSIDPQRIFLGGHSAGGHLSALLALDESLLKKYDVDPGIIRGVAALSGVYDLHVLPQFGSTVEDRRKASPITFVRKNAPPFLITYCQWDYLGLPLQAQELSTSLRKSFVPSRLLYVPGQTHITEVISMLKDGDPTTEAVVRFIETGQP